jgi:uncharacterized membrane protein YhiD involved in acid resistance
MNALQLWLESERAKYSGLWKNTPTTMKTAILVAIGAALFVGLGLGTI